MRPARLGRASWRGVRFLALLAVGVLLTLAFATFAQVRPSSRADRRQRVERWWLAAVAGALDLEVRVQGQPVRGAALVVANHVSWLDVLALGSVYGPGFVAKTEVATWPVVGWLAGQAGTLFVTRGSAASTASVVERMAWRLRQGRAVLLFPEGTTRRGPLPGEFRPRLFRPAVLVGVPIQPVALDYQLGDGRPAPVAAFVGDQTFLSHLLDLLAAPSLRVRVRLLPALQPSGAGDGRSLALRARSQVVLALAAGPMGSGPQTACNQTVTIAT